MLKLNYFLADIFILSAEKQPIKLSWRKIEWLHIFLMELAHEKGSYIHVVEEEVGIPYSLKKEKDVLTLIRMANRLGCEVIIRKVSDHDTEREDYTPEVFEAILKRMEEKSQKFYRK